MYILLNVQDHDFAAEYGIVIWQDDSRGQTTTYYPRDVKAYLPKDM